VPEAVAERVRAQLHQLTPQIADRCVERLGRGLGDEQVRHVLEHLTDRGDQCARREPAAAIELDRDLDGGAGRTVSLIVSPLISSIRRAGTGRPGQLALHDRDRSTLDPETSAPLATVSIV